MSTPEKRELYCRAIADMAQRKALWLSRNPNIEVLVSFPLSEKGHSIIGQITDGIEKGVVRCNPAGRELLEFMAGELLPTIVMTKTAFEMKL